MMMYQALSLSCWKLGRFFADARLGSETPRVFQGIDAIVLDEAHDFTVAMSDICACVLDCYANIPSVPHAYSLEVHLRGLWMRY